MSPKMRAATELSDRLHHSKQTRVEREFFTPEHISVTGNYYPRYQCNGAMESGSAHVSYLGRSYYSYKVPSVYGFSKFITVRKQ